MNTDQNTAITMAEANGMRDAKAGDEARPGCPISARGKAYMRGYIAGARS